MQKARRGGRALRGVGEVGHPEYRRPDQQVQHPFEGFLESIALFAPGVGVVVVAVPLPEPWLVLRSDLDAAEPLRALPEVLARDHEAERPAVLGRERLAVGLR